MEILNSNRKDKRFVAVFGDGVKIHFGLKNGNTYIDHGDMKKRDAYLARHSKNNEDWDNPRTAGSLSRWILWGQHKNINSNISFFKKKFGV